MNRVTLGDRIPDFGGASLRTTPRVCAKLSSLFVCTCRRKTSTTVGQVPPQPGDRCTGVPRFSGAPVTTLTSAAPPPGSGHRLGCHVEPPLLGVVSQAPAPAGCRSPLFPGGHTRCAVPPAPLAAAHRAQHHGPQPDPTPVTAAAGA